MPYLQSVSEFLDGPVEACTRYHGQLIRVRSHPLLGAPHGAFTRHQPGPGREDFPALPARAPFRWLYLERTFEVEFVGGLIGVSQDARTLCLRPETGCAVREAGGAR